jgi:2-hydroxychromene-2-carboxylate isomerase
VSCLPFDPVVRRAIVDALFREVWAGGRGVEDPSVVCDLLAGYGLDADAEIARATSDENKARLRTNTDDAIRRGVFGVPSIRIDDEVFWGFDSLPHVERFLDGHDPVTPEFLAQLAGLRASAARRA